MEDAIRSVLDHADDRTEFINRDAVSTDSLVDIIKKYAEGLPLYRWGDDLSYLSALDIQEGSLQAIECRSINHLILMELKG